MSEENIIDDPALLLEFIADSRELLEAIDSTLLELEKDPLNTSLLNELLRSLHTIKGTSAFLGLNKINRLSHKTEDLLKAFQDETIKPDNTIINLVFESMDTLKNLVDCITRAEDKKIGEFLGQEVESGPKKEVEIDEIIQKMGDALENGGPQPRPVGLPPDLVEQFIVEAKEHFETIEPLLIKLEKEPDDLEVLDDIFRSVHTIKGTSDYVGLTEIKELSHKIEGLLDRLRKGKIALTPAITEIMFEGMDTLRRLSGNLTLKDPEPVYTDDLIKRLEEILAGDSTGPERDHGHMNEAAAESPDPLRIFFESARQHLEAMGIAANEIKEEKNRDAALDMLLRSASTLKSSAGYMGEKKIGKAVQALLDTAGAIGTIGFDPILIEGLFEEIKKVRDIHAALLPSPLPRGEGKGEGAAKKSERPKPSPHPRGEGKGERAAKKSERPKVKEIKTVRVDQEKLDAFMNLVGELVVTRNAFYHLTEKIEIQYNLKELTEQMKNISTQVNRISGSLQNRVMEMRMIPVKNVFQRFPRMVRDLALKVNKKVELVIEGEETEIDKTVAEAIGDPLVHLIRNAVDHGIEPAAERVEAGKNETGAILLKAGHEGNNVSIEIIDDGQGINEEQVKKKAIEKELVSKEAADRLSHTQIINFILAPGFSTAREVTDISGRGVGMDVVKSNIQKIKGSIDITSEQGKGSKIKLNLPLTLAVFEALMVGIGNEKFAIPLESVLETIKVDSEELVTLRGKESVSLRGNILGLVRLADIFNITGSNGFREVPIVVMHGNGKTIGIVVDELFKQEDILIKPLDKFLSSVNGISGTTITGEGKVILVLDPAEIIGCIGR